MPILGNLASRQLRDSPVNEIENDARWPKLASGLQDLRARNEGADTSVGHLTGSISTAAKSTGQRPPDLHVSCWHTFESMAMMANLKITWRSWRAYKATQVAGSTVFAAGCGLEPFENLATCDCAVTYWQPRIWPTRCLESQNAFFRLTLTNEFLEIVGQLTPEGS